MKYLEALLTILVSTSLPRPTLAGTPVVYDNVSQSEAVEQVANVTQMSPLDFDALAYAVLVRSAKPHISR
jgi:hypothetical protein